MLLLIDGYNVLKPQSAASQVGERQRSLFIAHIAQYAQQTNNTALVVFDGGDSAFPERLQQSRVTVIYSGYRESADDILKKYIIAQKPDSAVLISTDRELCRHATYNGLATIDADVFYHYLYDTVEQEQKQQKIVRTETIKRTGHISSAEVDALMEEASSMMIPRSDDDYVSKDKKSGSKKLSKQEKRLQKIAKKL